MKNARKFFMALLVVATLVTAFKTTVVVAFFNDGEPPSGRVMQLISK